nr:MAG TPA: hypothetical protein [Caudoviricetes sp.]
MRHYMFFSFPRRPRRTTYTRLVMLITHYVSDYSTDFN